MTTTHVVKHLVDPPHKASQAAAGRRQSHQSKCTFANRLLALGMGAGLITNDGPHWAGQRRLLQPLFGNRNVNRFDEAINALTGELICEWDARVGKEALWVDRDMSRLALRIVGATLFASDFERYADDVAEIMEETNVGAHELRALLLLTGCRKGELGTLRWSDYREGRLFLRDSKTGPRTVWLSGAAREILERLHRTSSWVFPTNGASGLPDRNWPQSFWQRIRGEANLSDVRLHDLRQRDPGVQRRHVRKAF